MNSKRTESTCTKDLQSKSAQQRVGKHCLLPCIVLFNRFSKLFLVVLQNTVEYTVILSMTVSAELLVFTFARSFTCLSKVSVVCP